jgi:hypothetical protein
MFKEMQVSVGHKLELRAAVAEWRANPQQVCQKIALRSRNTRPRCVPSFRACTDNPPPFLPSPSEQALRAVDRETAVDAAKVRFASSFNFPRRANTRLQMTAEREKMAAERAKRVRIVLRFTLLIITLQHSSPALSNLSRHCADACLQEARMAEAERRVRMFGWFVYLIVRV